MSSNFTSTSGPILKGLLFLSAVTMLLPLSDCHAQLVGTHPDAINQATTAGRTLHTLHVADDNLYIGYGDYGANTGPINVRYFDTATDTFSSSLVTGNTEAFHRFRTIGSEVFATHADPQGGSLGGYARGPADASSPWTDHSVVNILHSYDIAQHGSTLFMAGSGGPTASENSIIYQSTDGGDNWSVSLDVASPLDGHEYSFSRFYGLGTVGGNLYSQQSVFYYDDLNGDGNLQYNGEYQPELNFFDGNSWQTGPLMRTATGESSRMIDPEFFADHLLFRDQHSGAIGPRALYAFDGIGMEEVILLGDDQSPDLSWDIFVDDTGAYALLEDGNVMWTDDLDEWHNIFSMAPANARSLAVHNGYLYFGGDNADLYRFAYSVPEPGTAGLMLSMLAMFSIRRRRGR